MDEIDRRRLLQVGAVAVGVGLAGCSGGGGDSGDNGTDADDGGENDTAADDSGENGTDTGGDTDGEENEQARESFDGVIDILDEVERLLSNFRDIEGEREQAQIGSEGIEELRGQLDDAGSTLAEIDASGDLATQVEIAQAVVAFQELLVDSLDTWREHDAQFRAAAEAQNAGDLQAAAEAYGEAASVLAEYGSLLDEIESAHSEIDSGSFEADALSYNQEVWTYLRIDSRGELDAREQFALAEQSRVSGQQTLNEAEASFNDEQWDAARQGYEDAQSVFGDAADAYGNVLDNDAAPDAIRESAEDRFERSSDLVDAMSLLAEASTEAANGNLVEAGELREDAGELIT